MDADIVLTVDEGQQADAAHFFVAGVHLLELLDDLADTANVDWAIADLHLASAVSGLAATGEDTAAGVAATRAAVTGLTHIRAGKGMPQDWTPNAVTRAKDLVRRAGDQAKIEAAGNVVWLDQRLRDGLETIAPWVREFYGSVRGQLTGVNVTRGNRASIKPQDGGRVVHVGFPTPLAEKMRTGLLEFVEVEGMLRQNEDGRTYYITADDVRVVERPTLSWQDLYGLMPDLTEGLTVGEYLDGIHGEE